MIEGEVEKQITFTSEELEYLRDNFIRLELMNNTSRFVKRDGHNVTPNEINNLSIYYDGETYEFDWSTDTMPPRKLVYESVEIDDLEDDDTDSSRSESTYDLKESVLNNNPTTSPGVVRDGTLKSIPLPGYEKEYQDYVNLCEFKDIIIEIVMKKEVYKSFPERITYE